MDRLWEHMRNHIGNAPSSVDSPENILNFPHGAPPSARYDTTATLDLVSQAAEAVRSIQDHARESEARASSLAQKAIDQLHLAEARIQSAEAARRVAEENLYKMGARLEEAENELMRTTSRIAATEAQLASAEERMKATEVRAIQAEKAFKQIELAIHKQLLGLDRNVTRRSASAA